MVNPAVSMCQKQIESNLGGGSFHRCSLKDRDHSTSRQVITENDLSMYEGCNQTPGLTTGWHFATTEVRILTGVG